MAFIGQSVRRFEDARFLTGQGRYVADLPVEGALHMVVLRSPHAHARICRIDTAAAQAFVLTAGALAEGGIGRLPCPAQIGAFVILHAGARAIAGATPPPKCERARARAVLRNGDVWGCP
jgi:hypothetical protein